MFQDGADGREEAEAGESFGKAGGKEGGQEKRRQDARGETDMGAQSAAGAGTGIVRRGFRR